MSDWDERTPIVVYGDDGATFERKCPQCGQFVANDGTITVDGAGRVKPGPNATCSKCGRVEMPFLGYW